MACASVSLLLADNAAVIPLCQLLDPNDPQIARIIRLQYLLNQQFLLSAPGCADVGSTMRSIMERANCEVQKAISEGKIQEFVLERLGISAEKKDIGSIKKHLDFMQSLADAFDRYQPMAIDGRMASIEKEREPIPFCISYDIGHGFIETRHLTYQVFLSALSKVAVHANNPDGPISLGVAFAVHSYVFFAKVDPRKGFHLVTGNNLIHRNGKNISVYEAADIASAKTNMVLKLFKPELCEIPGEIEKNKLALARRMKTLQIVNPDGRAPYIQSIPSAVFLIEDPKKMGTLEERFDTDLFEFIHKSKPPLQTRLTICRNMLTAVNYLHTKKCYHFDLKMENWLISRNLCDNSFDPERLRLTDFDGAILIEDFMSGRALFPVFTPMWTHYCDMAMLHKHWQHPNRQELLEMMEKCDVFTLGSAMIAVLTGAPPYFTDARPLPTNPKLTGNFPRHPDVVTYRMRQKSLEALNLPPDILDILEEAIDPNYKQRPSVLKVSTLWNTFLPINHKI